jgi:hypothetical protein
MYSLFLQPVDHCGQGRPRDAQEDVHPPGQPNDGRAVDAKSRLLPQAKADKQHHGQARTGECVCYLCVFSRLDTAAVHDSTDYLRARVNITVNQ